MTMVKLRSCTCVKPDCRTSFVFRHATRGKESKVVLIDSHSELDCHRHTLSIPYGGTNDVSQQIRSYWNGSTATLSRNFGNGTTEIHIEVIDTPFVDKTLDRLRNVIRIRAVQLKTARRFI